MRLLLDTHVLLWAARDPSGLSDEVAEEIIAADEVLFSVVSLWEIVIKRGLDRPDFRVDPQRLRAGLLQGGYRELPVAARHAFAVADLPRLHRDPFDRLLLAQTLAENAVLMTADEAMTGYPVALRRL